MDTGETILNSNKSRIVLLAGFLGAGKTTLLKQVLSSKTNMSDTVVIINEFGEIGIDASLIQRRNAEIVELTSGCICCTLALDLRILLKKIWEQYKPRYIFIEASGIADPNSLISVFNDYEFRSHIKSYKTVTVLDADFWEMRKIMGKIFQCQIEPADLIFLNKIDLIDAEKVTQYLKEIRESLPNVTIIPTIHCRTDIEDILWGDSYSNHPRLSHDYNEEHSAHTDENGFVTFSYCNSQPLDETCFKRFVRELPFGMFRMKGTVQFRDRNVLVNHVGGKSEWSDQGRVGETRLTFIGWNTTYTEVEQKLKECQMSL